uniref:Suppressor APC domain containing 1 n=1 Tax=Xiphophorus maculatus TaxID=8083 RepID=A0A3B5PSH5_XIPMA
MACRLSASGSYTVVIIPLRTSLHSQEALRFYLWVRRMKDLEQEKDALWSGLEVLEKGRLWYFQRLGENRALRCVETRYKSERRIWNHTNSKERDRDRDGLSQKNDINALKSQNVKKLNRYSYFCRCWIGISAQGFICSPI